VTRDRSRGFLLDEFCVTTVGFTRHAFAFSLALTFSSLSLKFLQRFCTQEKSAFKKNL